MFPLIARAHHGGKQDQSQMLDFSVNSNPLGPSPLLLEAWHRADLREYPEPAYLQTRTVLADWHQVRANQVVLGVGASELMYRICFALLEAGDEVLSIGSPFGEFARAAGLCKANLTITDRQNPALKKVRLLYLSNPHNPSGHHFADLEVDLAPFLDCADYVLLDEAYLPFLGVHPLGTSERLIRLQSPGKAHGLVGMRMAYALCGEKVAAQLYNLQSAWHIPASLDLVLRALPEAQGFVDQTLPLVQASARKLADRLEVPFQGVPFLLVPAPRASELTAFLQSEGIRVRDCASYGHPDFIRVSTQLEHDARFIQEFRRFYGP